MIQSKLMAVNCPASLIIHKKIYGNYLDETNELISACRERRGVMKIKTYVVDSLGAYMDTIGQIAVRKGKDQNKDFVPVLSLWTDREMLAVIHRHTAMRIYVHSIILPGITTKKDGCKGE